MKIYDSDGRLIHNVPDYQSGGFILPQYNPAQVTLQTPSSEGLFNTTQATANNSWNRYVQGEQVNAAKALNAQNFVTNIIDTKLKIQTQERVNKQLELQNKKFEYQIMKDNLDIVKESLAMGSQEFLEGDRAAIDKAYEPINDKIANTDWRDTNAVFDNHRQKLIIKNSFKNAYANKEAFVNGTKLIEENKNDKAIEYAAKTEALDFDMYEKYTTSKQEWAKALSEFEKTGDRSILDKAQQHKQNIETTQTFIDSDAFKQKIQIAQQVQQAKAQEDLANANMITQTTPSRIIINEAKARLDIAKANNEIGDMEFEQSQRKLMDSEWKLWVKENPNATVDELTTARNTIYNPKGIAANDGLPNSMNEEIARRVARGEMEPEDAMKLLNTKESTVNYTTDGAGNITGVKQHDGSIDYGGRTVDKDGVTVTSVTVNGEKFTTYTTGEDKGKVVGIPDATLTEVGGKGYLKLKGNSGDNLDWLMGKYPKYGKWYTNDSLKDFQNSDQAPIGTKYEGGYLYIPQDNLGVPQGTTGQSFFSGQNNGAAGVSPNNPFLK